MIPVLPQSKVEFIENRADDMHIYMLGFKELSGVTALLNEMLFKDKYNGISKEVLNNAANRGTAIHEAVQSYELGQPFSISDDLEEHESIAKKAVKSWVTFRSHEGIKYSALVTTHSEYLVSNEEDLATKIDLTMYDEGWTIGDIKTTSKLDMDFLSWQLSIEAYLFERQTGQKVKKLLAMWYDRKANRWQWYEVERKSDEEIENLINAWRDKKNGVEVFEFKEEEKELPAPIVQLGKLLAEKEQQINTLKTESEMFRTRLLEEMKKYGIMQIKTDDCTISYVAPSTKQTFNKDVALATYPDLAEVESIYKVSNVKESIKIILK